MTMINKTIIKNNIIGDRFSISVDSKTVGVSTFAGVVKLKPLIIKDSSSPASSFEGKTTGVATSVDVTFCIVSGARDASLVPHIRHRLELASITLSQFGQRVAEVS